MAKVDLWGEGPTPTKVTTPYTILREQAQILSKKTGDLLQGSVVGIPVASKEKFAYELRVVAPVLNGYTFTVLDVMYGPAPFPVQIKAAWEDMYTICLEEDEFTLAVGGVLSSERMKEVLANLLSQSQEQKPKKLHFGPRTPKSNGNKGFQMSFAPKRAKADKKDRQ